MRIKKLTLDHFKRFTNLVVDLGENPKKLVVIVGPNGCGKSSVFDAIEQVSKRHRGGSFAQEYASKKHYLENTDSKYNESKAVNIECTEQNIGKDNFYVRSSYRFVPNLNINAIQQLRDIADDEGRPNSSSALDNRLEKNYERLIGRFFNDVYDKDITGKDWAKRQVDSINEILTPILDVRISWLGNPVENKGKLYFKKGSSKDFPYENLSSGEKEVIDLVLDLVVKTAHFKNTVFCIDEPELHINTAIQRKLLIELEKLIPDTCQLWIATHSIGFLRAVQQELRDKCDVLDFSGHDFDTNVTLTPLSLSRDDWKRIFETALEDLTGLISPKTLVYCEGKIQPDKKGQGVGLDEVVYNQIFSTEFPNVLFLSSGGQTQPDKNSELALLVLSKAFDDVKILLLKDRDINSDGSPTTIQQRNDWIEKKTHRRMLGRKEIENYLFDSEILKRAYPDKFNEEKYIRIVKDIVNDSVKEKVADIMQEVCGIISDVNKEEFKKELAKYIATDTNVYSELKREIFLIGTVAKYAFANQAEIDNDKSELIWDILREKDVFDERGNINAQLTINREKINTWLGGESEAVKDHVLVILQQALIG